MISFAALALIRRPPVLRGVGVLGRVVALIGSTCFGLVVFLPWQDLPPLMLGISLALIALGWSLALYTLWHLGRSLSIMPEARQLVTTGPYRIVRHPLYLCELVAMLGAALQFALPEALILWAIQVGFLFARSLNEERVLRTAFAEYEPYAARTARILPGLY
jgi:protein-S-isoprenylcysteine O-methyltransferase Ste14